MGYDICCVSINTTMRAEVKQAERTAVSRAEVSISKPKFSQGCESE